MNLRLAIVAAFVLMSLGYAFATPIFEKNDEESHAWFAHHLALGGDLPVQVPGQPDSALQREGSQPPLYYWLAGAVMRQFDLSDFDYQMQPNQSPQFNPYAPNNKNLLVITPQKRAFNYEKSTLAAVVLRLLGIIPGVVTAWFVFAIASAVTQHGRLALLAMGLTAFNPMFIQVMTALGNDGLVIALSTVALYVLVRSIVAGFTAQRLAIGGLVIALASLSKVSGSLLLPVAAVAILGRELMMPSAKTFGRRLATVAMQGSCLLLIWVVVAGWWYWRNLQLYGDVTGTAIMAQMMTPRNFTLVQALSEWEGFKMSYIAMFGQFAVPADDVVYVGFDVLLIASGIGLVAWAARTILTVRSTWRGADGERREGRLRLLGIGLLTLHVALLLISVVRWTMMTPASHGRLIYPGIAGVSTLVALAVMQFQDLVSRFAVSLGVKAQGDPSDDRSSRRSRSGLRPRAMVGFVAHNAVSLIALVPLGLVAAISPYVYVIPAYTPPLVSEVPVDLIPVKQRMGTLADVVAYRMTPEEVRPGDRVRVSVALRALRSEPFNYSLVTKLYGRNGVQLARFDTFTGKGLWPSSLWRPGDLFLDEVELTVPVTAAAPSILRVQFELYNAGSGDIAASSDGAGNKGAPMFDGATLLPQRAAQEPVRGARARFGDLAELVGYRHAEPVRGQPLELTLEWRALRRAPKDFTVFVQMLDAKQNIVAQHDKPPLDGHFPTTRWSSGVAFADQYTLNVPTEVGPGPYRIAIGLYDPATGERLPVALTDRDDDGLKSTDNAIVISGVKIE